MIFFTALAILPLLLASTVSAKFPTEIERCRAGDQVCVARVMTDVVGKLSSGHPGINLPSIDPLHVSAINIAQGERSPVSIKLNLIEQDLVGLKHVKVQSVRGFEKIPDGQVFSVNATVKQVKLLGDYKINGRVLVLPIQGQGKSNLTLDHLNINLKYVTQSTLKGNKVYTQMKKFRFTFDVDRLYIYLENLFNGDKALSDNMNLFLNENWRDIFQELKPSIEDAFSQIFNSILNGIFAKVAYSDFYIE